MLYYKLASVGTFDLRLHHLLIIGILVASFSISFILRASTSEYGFELHEFDPFFNYRATQYIIDNGISDYFNWTDELSWYPYGRDVSGTSQVMLHMTAATTYWIFGGGMDLYDFTILFPAVFGSLTAIVIFALVRTIGGTSAGLLASLFFSVSIPVLIRGQFGWFKSEPLGLFFSLLSLYFLLSGINSQNKKIAISKLIGAGILTTFAISSWGGNQFFIIPIGIFFLSLPFLRKDSNFIIWAIPLYTIITLGTSLAIERVASSFVYGLGGISLIIPTIFLVCCILIQKKSKENHRIRNGLLLLLGIVILGSALLIFDTDGTILPTASHRYLNAINPFLTTTDPLVDSVSEHATTTISQSFFFHSVLMLFSGIGVWILFKKQKTIFLKSDMLVFALIIGLAGVYTSSTFVRLELFASISVIILSSIGIRVLLKELFSTKTLTTRLTSKILKISFLSGIVILLMIPVLYPENGQVYAIANGPPTIMNGGTAFLTTSTTDWLDALDWMKNNTPHDAVIASWWDYGYWIQTLGERASLADNSTGSTKIIQEIARMLLSSPDDAWHKLNEMQADYVVTFVAANKLNLDATEELFTLSGGGDESKKQWFMRIAEYDASQFLHSDGLSGTDYFWNETLLGQMFPYTVLGYLDASNIQRQSATYSHGLTGIYQKDIKYPSDGDGPLRLVYASPSFHQLESGPKLVVLIYEVNKEYAPLS